jgi:hypothetical protein
MMNKTVTTVSVTILLATLAACTTTGGPSDEEILLEAGATRLSGDEVKARVTGKTEEWLRGGAYYRDDGSIRVKWRKVYSSGSWQVTTDGELCYEVPRWDRRCHSYLNRDGQILMLEEGRNMGARPLFDGDRLSTLGSFNTGDDRRR